MKIAIIGLGARGKKFLEAVLSSKAAQLVAVCDSNADQVNKISTQHKVPGYTSVQQLVNSADKPDMAIVVLPHDQYLPVITILAKNNIHVLKEKPFACNLTEANKIADILQANKTHMMVGVQRRFDIIYQAFPGFIAQLGKIYHIEGRYTLCVDRLDQGWRASKKQAGGGALLDMGYHVLDLLIWYFGKPSSFELRKTSGNRFNQNYDVEDTAVLAFDYLQKFVTPDEKAIGTFTISRLGHKAQEKLTVRGSEGCVILERDRIRHFDKSGHLVGELVRGKNIICDPVKNMVEHYIRFLQGREKQLICDYRQHFTHMEIIDHAYAVKYDKAVLKRDYSWPPISQDSEIAVTNQLRKGEISIYDRSGVFKEFEDKFKDYHQRKYALLTNSGTSALFSAYEGLNLQPGDEVIVPVYTFFATASPLFQFGVKPVLCDCLPDGNIDPRAIAKKITARTKAIVITHMWGVPCEMDEIVAISQQYNFPLIEDCSHAHGARYKNQLVGTFGAAAIWSLQGQKIITAGEGGILLTNDEEIYTRAQLHGHYNKRCQQEIRSEHSLYKFATTGFGLKLRAHPLAIALANQQFDHLDRWLAYKNHYAELIIKELADIPFLQMPVFTNKTPAWYALTLKYDETRSGCSIDEFVKQLHAHGLNEIERPKSTRPLHQLPLFQTPELAIPRFYKENGSVTEAYPMADKIYNTLLKMPVWAQAEDEVIVKKYIAGIKAVADKIMQNDVYETASTIRARL